MIYTTSETGVYAFRAADGRQLWRATPAVKRTFGAPQVIGTVVYISLDDTIYALNASSGSKRWSVAVVSGTDVAGGPTYFDGVPYTISSFGDVTANSASDGKQRWSQHTTARPDFYSRISTPAADGSGVYFGSGDHYFSALDKATGSVKWKYLTRGAIHSSPAVANGVVYFGGEDSYIYALKTSDGSLLWRFKTEREVLSSPVVAGRSHGQTQGDVSDDWARLRLAAHRGWRALFRLLRQLRVRLPTLSSLWRPKRFPQANETGSLQREPASLARARLSKARRPGA